MLSRIIALAALSCLISAAAGAADWETDFAKAKAQAGKEQKFILMDFSGSDWCPWCIKLEREVFSKPEFKKYAKDSLVCVLIDSPREKRLPSKVTRQNTALKAKYGVNGFPTVILLSPAGEELARTGYQPGGAAKYVESLQKLLAPHQDKLTPVPAAKKAGDKTPDQPPPVPAEDVHNALNNAL